LSFVAAALLYFFIGRHQQAWICSVFKILPSLILFLALLSTDRRSRSSGGSVLLCMAALFFSMLGDVFGEWKGGPAGMDAFILQIASFAVAQIFYTVSFVRCFSKGISGLRSAVRVVLSLMLITYMVRFGMYVLSCVDTPSLKIAVTVYVLLIGMMGVSSVIQCREKHWCFILGALLFICSDSIIAYRSFVGPVPQAGLLIMSTYYAAQLMLNIPLVKGDE